MQNEALLEGLEDGGDSPDAFADLERSSEVVAALEKLDGRCRDLLTRLFLDAAPPSYSELSEDLGLPVGSIGPTRMRCLEKLARLLGAPEDSSGS